MPRWQPSNNGDPPIRQPKYATPPGGDDQHDRIRAGVAIFNGAPDIRGTPAETYLVSRGLKIEEDLAHVLRFSANLKFNGEAAIGMVALLRDIRNNDPCGIHRTFLAPDGSKIDRKMLGRAKGAAIKLDAHEDVSSGLHVGEGIETCQSARQLGFLPVWAVGSAGALADFPILPGIEAVTMFSE